MTSFLDCFSFSIHGILNGFDRIRGDSGCTTYQTVYSPRRSRRSLGYHDRPRFVLRCNAVKDYFAWNLRFNGVSLAGASG